MVRMAIATPSTPNASPNGLNTGSEQNLKTNEERKRTVMKIKRLATLINM